MNMTIAIILIMLGAGVGLWATTRTRTARLAQMARLNGCRFDKEKDTVTTELTAGRLEFFTLFFHQYQNVCTWSDNLAFMRVADDNIYTDDNPKTKPLKLTLFTAELKKRQFPALKIAPIDSQFAPSQYALMKTNIPAVDSRYRVHAPTPAAGLVLTPFLIGLLKTRGNMYLELNDNALVYHENTCISVEDYQSFRFRAMQILHELENALIKLAKTDPASTATLSPKPQDEAELRAEAMLKALCSPREAAGQKEGSGFRGVWIIMLLAVLLGISLLSWFALNNWVQR